MSMGQKKPPAFKAEGAIYHTFTFFSVGLSYQLNRQIRKLTRQMDPCSALPPGQGSKTKKPHKKEASAPFFKKWNSGAGYPLVYFFKKVGT
jgi:hypothetical protein